MSQLIFGNHVLLFQEKLQSEQINAESSDNKAAMTKIQFELDKTCKELQVITKKEALLREVDAKRFSLDAV